MSWLGVVGLATIDTALDALRGLSRHNPEADEQAVRKARAVLEARGYQGLKVILVRHIPSLPRGWGRATAQPAIVIAFQARTQLGQIVHVTAIVTRDGFVWLTDPQLVRSPSAVAAARRLSTSLAGR